MGACLSDTVLGSGCRWCDSRLRVLYGLELIFAKDKNETYKKLFRRRHM